MAELIWLRIPNPPGYIRADFVVSVIVIDSHRPIKEHYAVRATLLGGETFDLGWFSSQDDADEWVGEMMQQMTQQAQRDAE